MEPNNSTMRGPARLLTRRGFVQRCLLSAVALRLAGCAAVPIAARTDRLIYIGAELTGVPATAIDPAMAGHLMRAFLAAGRGAEFARLLAEEAEITDDALTRDLIVALYSGIHPVQPGDPDNGITRARTEVVATYVDALIWQALDFARPQGVCSGIPGHWSLPPGA